MKQAHVFISGFVQGVGFRAYIRSKSKKFGVAGWTRNLSDGRVEAVFQGEKEKVEKLISICNKGSFFSNVSNVVIEWEEVGEVYTDFTKRETV